MRNIRALIAMCIALLLAGLASYAVYNRLQQPKRQKEPPPTAKAEVQQKIEEPPPRFSHSIEPGFRALTLDIDMSSGGIQKIAIGDRVDVLAISPAPGDKDGRIARLLIGDVKVLDVNNGTETGGRSGRKQAITLQTTPKQAAHLAAADSAATLRLVMRNQQDQAPFEDVPSAFSSASGMHSYLPHSLDIEALVARGMRAMTLEVAATDGVGGLFRPGDRVDIVVTCPWGNVSLQSENEPGGKATLKETHRNSKIYFENLKIIATDQSTHWNSDRNQAVRKVSLEVTPHQAEELTVLADSKEGKNVLRLISRNRNDDQMAGTQGVELLDLLGGRTPYSKVRIYRGAMVQDQVFYRRLEKPHAPSL